MVNGAARYMPDADSYKKITYEAMNSSYRHGSAEIFAGSILDTLETMQGAAAR